MDWKNFEAWRGGWVAVQGAERGQRCPYELGVIVTGKQRVFHRYAIRLTLENGAQIVGEDEFNLRDALRDLASQLDVRDMTIIAAGVDERFSESGLSHNSGFGYIEGHDGAVHMMSVPPRAAHGSPTIAETIAAEVDRIIERMDAATSKPSSH